MQIYSPITIETLNAMAKANPAPRGKKLPFPHTEAHRELFIVWQCCDKLSASGKRFTRRDAVREAVQAGCRMREDLLLNAADRWQAFHRQMELSVASAFYVHDTNQCVIGV